MSSEVRQVPGASPEADATPRDGAGADPHGPATAQRDPHHGHHPAHGRLTRARAHLNRVGWKVLRRVPGVAAIVGTALTGGILGAVLAPSTTAEIGPLTVQVRVVPSLDPGVHLLLPPAGEVNFDTHLAPVALEGDISQVDLEAARSLIESPAQVRALGDTAGVVLRGAAIRAALTTAGCSLLGAVLLGFLVYRRAWRRTAVVGGTLVGVLVLTGGVAAASADPRRLAQPRFTGLLSQAPYIAGEVPDVLQRLETYRSGLADIVKSVTALYATAGGLSGVETNSNEDVVTLLHVSDIHLNPLAFDLIERLSAQFGVDAVLDTGDITTWGTEAEASTLSRIGELKTPYVFVRGNHDSAATQKAVAKYKNAVVLDGRVAEVQGLVIAGIGDPVFTPDGDEPAPSPSSRTPQPTRTGPAVGLLPTTSGPFRVSPGAPTPGATGTPSTPTTPTGKVPPAARAAVVPTTPSGPQAQSNTRLAGVIESWNAEHPDKPVQMAMVHEPYQLEPLFGRVRTVLAGHTHSRSVKLDASGTRIMVEGSTGGAGITARGLVRLADGKPLPLAASLVYYARRGPRAGQVIAMDAITVGGFGLTSVNLERSVIPPPSAPLRHPADLPALEPTPSTPATRP